MNNTTTPGERLLNYIKHPFKSWQIDKAKRIHRNLHPACSVCGTDRSKSGNRCDVHHIQPCHAKPDLACTPSNLVTLCRECHWQFGHCGLSWKTWDGNVLITVDRVRLAFYGNSRPCKLNDEGSVVRVEYDR